MSSFVAPALSGAGSAVERSSLPSSTLYICANSAGSSCGDATLCTHSPGSLSSGMPIWRRQKITAARPCHACSSTSSATSRSSASGCCPSYRSTVIPLRVRLDSRKWYSDALRTASQQRVPANPSTPFFSGYCAP